MAKPSLSLSDFQTTVASLSRTPNLLAARIWDLLPFVVGPSINHFAPIKEIRDDPRHLRPNFSPTKADNLVTVGGEPASGARGIAHEAHGHHQPLNDHRAREGGSRRPQ